MCREWWELSDDESRIMSLYRRFDAVNHLPRELTLDGVNGLGRNDLEEIIEVVGTLIPETSIDFMAQSVMLAYVGKIAMTSVQLKTYSQQLENYVESECEPGYRAEIPIVDEILGTWTRYWRAKPVPVGNRVGVPSAIPV